MLKGRNVLWEVLRPVVGWPLRSPLRLFTVLAGVFLVGVVISNLSDSEAPPADGTDEASATATATPGDAETATATATPDQELATATAAPGDEAGHTAELVEDQELVTATAAPGDEEGHTAEPEEVEVVEDHAESTAGTDDDGHGHDDDDSWVTLAPGDEVPVFDPEGEVEEEIAATAVAAAEAMARPGDEVEEEEWWEEFAPHLTERARGDYEGTDPQQVPFTEVDTDTGGKMLPRPQDTPDLLRLVQVGTDVGPITVHVQRETDGWAVSRISWTDPWPQG